MTSNDKYRDINRECDYNISQDELLEACRMPTMIISPDEQKLIADYRRLNEKQKSAVLLIIEAMIGE